MAEKKKSNLLKNLVFLVILIGAGVFLFMQYQKRQLIMRENAATELFNQGNNDGALAAYKQIHGRLSGDDRARLGGKIALCYTTKAEDPGLSVKEQVVLYKQALEYDKSCVTDPRLLKLIEGTE
ncbi:MAG: hypothetical protein HN742_10055 [Lentisphaerae bacterium]|jgi:hypothetical protein|nr:hypothetical protein [Lentisphaerota bacterium]MBT4817128.1 hypothetical protein [Lentisphaerota bacterium]MBT5610413.1 hypothetical protein [Lentisphaerota bacterium]MBT7060190.1 hypothetical protein [Lentisphaerota bacterium]MBT7842205.1 hypothetical protein [Lentisphaerota bacterium]